jgi:hypothetical protein
MTQFAFVWSLKQTVDLLFIDTMECGPEFGVTSLARWQTKRQSNLHF